MKRIAFTFLLLLALALSAGAQTEQQISGTVLDASGAAVPNATVTITNVGTGATRTTTGNSEGYYVVANLPPGIYNVAATAPGFKRFVSQNVILSVGSKPSVNASLAVGEVSETVEVQAQALQVETTTGEVGHLVTSTEAIGLQLNGRNYVQLVGLAPGTSTTYTSSFRGLYGPFGNNAAAHSVNGTRPDSATFLVNNVDNKDPGGPSSNSYVNVSPDFIGEFKTIAASQSAQYGLNSGPTVTMVLKSGTREFHGTAYEYFRNDAIQARSFNSPAKKPPLRYNNFGWSLGGPVTIPGVFNDEKDKVFFFVGQDFKRRRAADIVALNVPTLNDRQGIGVLNIGETPDPTGQRLVNLYPLPSAPGTCTGGNFCFQRPEPLDVNEYIFKGDYIISAGHSINGHFMYDGNKLLGGTNFPANDLFLFDRTIPGFNAGVQWTAVVNPTTVNTVTLGFAGNRITEKQNIRPNPAFGYTTTESVLKATYGLNYPTIFNATHPLCPNGSCSSVIPTVQIAGFSNFAVTPLSFDNVTRTFTIKNDFSKVLGNHTLKTGLTVQRGRKNQDTLPALNGTFFFQGTGNASAIANALRGNFFTYTEGAVIPQAWARYTNIEPYVQDDWKVSQRLTMNLGLRWAYQPPVYLALHNGSSFLPEFYDPARAPIIAASGPNAGQIVSAPGTYDPYNGLVIDGSGFPERAEPLVPESIRTDPAVLALFRDQPQGFANTDWNNFSPRVGFAYDINGKQTTVVRGGFGMVYERIRTTAANATSTNPPFVSNVQVRNGLASNPPGGAAPRLPVSINRAIDPNLRNPQVLNWTLGVQQSVGESTVFDIYYAGSRGNDLTYSQNINQLREGTIQANPGVNPNALRPYKGYTDIFMLTNGGIWNYHSLQTQFQKRMRDGGNIRVSYTWSKNLTDSYDAFYVPMDSYDIGRDYGPAPFNKPHVLVLSYNYPLPFWRTGGEWYKKAFGGWSVTGITQYTSGWPLNAFIAQDTAGVASNPGTSITIDGGGAGGFNQRADLIGDPYANTNRIQHLNPAAFAVPPAGRYGNAGPFAFRGPRISNWDITAAKDFRITERVNLNFRAEMFNAFNHLSYVRVNSQVGTGTFGRVNGATDPRTFEFALRLTF
ncbi:MAG: carboxypeptidase regulatory-like domain-containing protein [Candidatus Korobacteraceae bacterium]